MNNNKKTAEAYYDRQQREMIRKMPERREEISPEILEDLGNYTFFRICVRADRRIYAYEADKMIFLQILDKKISRYGFELVAFAVLDDEFDAILACRDELHSGSDMLREIEKAYDQYYKEKRDHTCCVKETVGWSTLPADKVAEACNDIHFLAVVQGYASDAADFWWSSLNQYKGRYEWTFLDNRWVGIVRQILQASAEDPGGSSRA